MFVGHGSSRLASETNWQVNTSNPDNWVWTEVTNGGNYHGYKTTGPAVKRWGTNRLANPRAATYQGAFDNILSSTTGVLSLKTSGNTSRDVISMLTSFEQAGTGWRVAVRSSGCRRGLQ